MHKAERIIITTSEFVRRWGGEPGEQITRKAFLVGVALASVGLTPKRLRAGGGGGGSCTDCCVEAKWAECYQEQPMNGCPEGWEVSEECGCWTTQECWNVFITEPAECYGSACCDCAEEPDPEFCYIFWTGEHHDD